MGNAMQQQMERIAYQTYCKDFKLKPEWLDKKVRNEKGKTYTIIGLNIRSKRFPVTTKEGPRLNADYLRGLMTGDMDSIKEEREQEREKEYKQARKDYRKYAQDYGLEKSWLDQTLVSGRTTYRIDGLIVNRRTKYPVLVRKPDGLVSFFSTYGITELMKKQKAT